MDKAQAIHQFWSSFGLPAYDENTVPQNASMPRITYNVATDSLETVVNMSASLWYRSTSWQAITQKAAQIEKYLSRPGGKVIDIDIGKVWIVKGSPFAQRMADPDDSIRRMYLNIQVEFLTPY